MCVLLFSSLELLVSFFVKSFKEGQIISIPLMFAVLIPFYIVMISQYDLTSSALYWIPFLNIPLLLMDIVAESMSVINVFIFF